MNTNDGAQPALEVGQHVVGTVTRWFQNRGYGFIRTPKGDLFIHQRRVPERADLDVGERIGCFVHRNPNNDKLEGVDIMRLDYRQPPEVSR